MDEFGKYLAKRRGYRTRVRIENPAADEMVEILQKHLKTIAAWLNGAMNRTAMLDAMQFFHRTFPGHYSATEGRLVYRGQSIEAFDGGPRSYSYDAGVAKDFACDLWDKSSFVIKRKVCSSCGDKSAFRLSLDIAKVMKAYSVHKFSGEKEVVILNTPPHSPAELLEVPC